MKRINFYFGLLALAIAFYSCGNSGKKADAATNSSPAEEKKDDATKGIGKFKEVAADSSAGRRNGNGRTKDL